MLPPSSAGSKHEARFGQERKEEKDDGVGVFGLFITGFLIYTMVQAEKRKR